MEHTQEQKVNIDKPLMEINCGRDSKNGQSKQQSTKEILSKVHDQQDKENNFGKMQEQVKEGDKNKDTLQIEESNQKVALQQQEIQQTKNTQHIDVQISETDRKIDSIQVQEDWSLNQNKDRQSQGLSEQKKEGIKVQYTQNLSIQDAKISKIQSVVSANDGSDLSNQLQFVHEETVMNKNQSEQNGKPYQFVRSSEMQVNESGLSENHSKTYEPFPVKLSDQISWEQENNMQISRSSISKSEIGNNSEDNKGSHISLNKHSSSPIQNMDEAVSNDDETQQNKDMQQHKKQQNLSVEANGSQNNQNSSQPPQAEQIKIPNGRISQIKNNIKQKLDQQENKKKTKLEQLQKKKAAQIQRKSIEKIIKTAEQERVAASYAFFLNYLTYYNAIYQGHKILIQTILESIENKRKLKVVPSYLIRQHLNQQSNILHTFYQKCYSLKLTNHAIIGYKQNDKNPMLNMKQDLLEGLQELINSRKNLGNSMNRVHEKIHSHTIKQIQKIFDEFQFRYKQAYKALQQFKNSFEQKYKQYNKRSGFCKIVFSEIMQGKFSETNDIFAQLAGYVQIDKHIKWAISSYGRALADFRKKVIKADIVLFQEIQSALQSYQEYSSKNHVKIKIQHAKINFKGQISKIMQYSALCSAKDFEYINSLEQCVFKTQKPLGREISQQQFQRLLNLDWDKVIKVYGSSQLMLRGSFLKQFQLKNPQKCLISTVCNNLIEFNKQSYDCQHKIVQKNMIVSKIKENNVKVQEKCKTFIFETSKSWSFQFFNNNIAEQFAIYFQRPAQ